MSDNRYESHVSICSTIYTRTNSRSNYWLRYMRYWRMGMMLLSHPKSLKLVQM
ncbi:unnamed protein product [Brassica oleracea var. botrytis]|uniref:Uncharacterized protein n=2 Tax=Brassica oleracea TaxID=3712 RepID=A0A0D3AP52_BRAOL|nr:unnamed protein product [Brassica oleracea]